MKTLFFTLLFASLAFAGVAKTNNDSVKIVELEKIVESLQTKLSERDALYESHLKDIKENRDGTLTFFKENLEFVKWFIVVIGSLILLLLSGFEIKSFYDLRKWKEERENAIKEDIRVKLSEQVSNQIEREKELLTKLIDERDLDSKIKKNMKIAVVYKESINGDLDAALKRLGYMHENKKEDADADLSGYDLIFIDNSKNEFGYIDKDPNSAPGFIKTHDKGNSAFFYYNETRMNDPFKYQTKAQGFANSLSSLNHNLLDVMRYKWVVIDGKK